MIANEKFCVASTKRDLELLPFPRKLVLIPRVLSSPTVVVRYWMETRAQGFFVDYATLELRN